MTHTTVYNRVIKWPHATAAEVAFLERLGAAVEDGRVSPEQMRGMVYGPDNPILDHDAVPGQALVTKVTLKNPLLRVCTDYLNRKDLHLGRTDLAKLHAPYTIDVPTAAEQLGESPQSVQAKIDSFKYDALFTEGRWLLRPETIAVARLIREAQEPATVPDLRLSRVGGRLVSVADAS